MSDIVMCNHCQEMFKRENTTYGTIEGFWNEVISIDLCDKCKNKLDEWLHPEETEILKNWIKEEKK